MTKRALTKDVATTLYSAVPDGDARKFIDYLIDHPGVQVWSEAMQEDLGFAEHKQIALAARTIGEEASKLGVDRPWNEAQRGYTMTESTAELLSVARSGALPVQRSNSA